MQSHAPGEAYFQLPPKMLTIVPITRSKIDIGIMIAKVNNTITPQMTNVKIDPMNSIVVVF